MAKIVEMTFDRPPKRLEADVSWFKTDDTFENFGIGSTSSLMHTKLSSGIMQHATHSSHYIVIV